MSSIAQVQEVGRVIRYDREILPELDPRIFDVAALRSEGIWLSSSPGRSQAHFFALGDRTMVLRHFLRGGLVSRISHDLFVRTAPRKSRALREFDLLDRMRARGLPVPRPVAARFVPAGPFYRADIITERIPDARPLAEILHGTALPSAVWAQIGTVIREFHDHGIFHGDLNARNILIDDDRRPWIIDFDKCHERGPGRWRQDNLDRLRRSLGKERRQYPDLAWGDPDWTALMSGYEGAGVT